jgi:GNAT superfamily N-acetyltransferase
MWFEPKAPAYEGWLLIQLSNRDWWLSDIYVSPDHRGKGIANQLDQFGRTELANHGVNNVAGVANALNYAVLRSSEKGRYYAVRIWYIRILGWTLIRLPRRWLFGWWALGRSLKVSLSEIMNTVQ